MYLGEINFTLVLPEDIEQFNLALQKVGYYIKPSDDADADENCYDLYKRES